MLSSSAVLPGRDSMTVEEIPLIPEVPDRVRLAAREGTLVPFVGAGVSRLAGAPDWSSLANGALRSFCPSGELDFSMVTQLGELSPRVRLSLALGLAAGGGRIDWNSLLHPSGEDRTMGTRLASALWRLGRVVVTTNYDRWLDRAPVPAADPKAAGEGGNAETPNPIKVIHEVAGLTPGLLGQANTVVHLHGSVNEPLGMILTTRHYAMHYANDRAAATENRVLTFLESLFKERTVLFVGYGLEEIELIEHVINRSGPSDERRSEPRHFALQGFFSHQIYLMQSLRRYFASDLGVGLLPYRRDVRDWLQLAEVLDKFAKDAPAADTLPARKKLEMEDWLRD
jgi:hypothetical protein